MKALSSYQLALLDWACAATESLNHGRTSAQHDLEKACKQIAEQQKAFEENKSLIEPKSEPAAPKQYERVEVFRLDCDADRAVTRVPLYEAELLQWMTVSDPYSSPPYQVAAALLRLDNSTIATVLANQVRFL